MREGMLEKIFPVQYDQSLYEHNEEQLTLEKSHFKIRRWRRLCGGCEIAASLEDEKSVQS
jgi:hypothetical protein